MHEGVVKILWSVRAAFFLDTYVLIVFVHSMRVFIP